jgi:GNAT superfamily N-acetyltransferase
MVRNRRGGRGFGKELMKRAVTYAIERGCTDAYLDTFSFQTRPFYENRFMNVATTYVRLRNGVRGCTLAGTQW